MEAVKVEDTQSQEAVRKVLFETFCQQYQSLADFIQKLPINPDMKGKVGLYMDTGFLWAKEAFVLMDIQAKKAALSAVKDAGDEAPTDPEPAFPSEY